MVGSDAANVLGHEGSIKSQHRMARVITESTHENEKPTWLSDGQRRVDGEVVYK